MKGNLTSVLSVASEPLESSRVARGDSLPLGDTVAPLALTFSRSTVLYLTSVLSVAREPLESSRVDREGPTEFIPAFFQ